jgi:hypothetical protein
MGRAGSLSARADADARVVGVEGDEGEDALGAARELDRRRDLTPPRRVEDGVDTMGTGAHTRSESPSP